MKIGIVILNYLNWEDTIECVESLLKQTHDQLEIVVVDNHSCNESTNILYEKYGSQKKFHLIETDTNVGFAKGNNTGIEYCKKVLNINNIYVTNNDVVFTDNKYFEKLLKISITENVGAIGTRIKGSDGINQNPIKVQTNLYALIRHFFEPILKELGFSKVLTSGHKAVQFIKRKVSSKSKNRKISNKNVTTTNQNYFLHGSAIYFTDNYLKNTSGFYPDTFLYYEENILAIIFEKLNLQMLYIDDLEIYHKEDQSMALSFKDVSKSKRQLQRKSIVIAIRVKLSSIQRIVKRFKTVEYSYKEY
ncbi:Glycosyltransferase, GT2 family [Alkalibacterium gilvum]|uniref:Glycosyltransferase, GT2 family n=1 Tax=Alkalibacterium gilvum TaxID=1130080 RepID=A0A1H6RE48_9LACT|nr:glycosyltransferase [Alkalibacterium gilvum]SEI54099.1 Glycosyltransferase, GT2 family [Alkalibacterium gilvum]